MAVAQQVQRIPERLADTMQHYTPKMPSLAYLGIAIGATAILLWSLIGTYMDFTDYRASSLRWRSGDLHPPGV